MLYEDDQPLHIISSTISDPTSKTVKSASQKGRSATEARGDTLSKGLVIVQTSWFILQCIARRAVGLPITELELVTVAFAALNFVTYALWWNKPLNVVYPMRVYRRKQGEVGQTQLDADLDEANVGAEQTGPVTQPKPETKTEEQQKAESAIVDDTVQKVSAKSNHKTPTPYN